LRFIARETEATHQPFSSHWQII